MIIEKNGLQYFVFENLTQAGLRHCFTTRLGGVSERVFSSLNLGFHNGDCPNAVAKNLRRICDAVGFDVRSIVMAKQVHETTVSVASEKTDDINCDGLITNESGITLATYYADCVPILLFDPIKRVIANAHAGWRGCAKNMAQAAVSAMQSRYGCNPADVLAGIGPSISAKNFEVDAEVAHNFKKNLPFCDNFIYNSKVAENKFHIDLWGICRQSLILAGLCLKNIEIAGLCTFDLPKLFYSHRRDGMPRGNMMAMIGL